MRSGPQGLGEEAWTEPFQVELTGRVRFDAPNTLVVRAEADTTLGGLWRGAAIYSPR